MTRDSAAWCLNGKGEVVGILIGGGLTGSGLIIPMESVIEDLEAFLMLPSSRLMVLDWGHVGGISLLASW